MKISTLIGTACGLTLSATFALPSYADNCDIRFNDRVLDGICDFREMFGDDLNLRFDLRKRPTLHLPNLQVDGMDHFPLNGAVLMAVDIENTHWPDAGEHDVHIVVTEHPLNAAPVNHRFRVRAIGGVPGGTSVGFNIGQIQLANPADNTDLTAMVSIDTPSAQRPSGEVIEENETDNTRMINCTIFGSERPRAGTYRGC